MKALNYAYSLYFRSKLMEIVMPLQRQEILQNFDESIHNSVSPLNVVCHQLLDKAVPEPATVKCLGVRHKLKYKDGICMSRQIPKEVSSVHTSF